jgi:hypothetical protein
MTFENSPVSRFPLFLCVKERQAVRQIADYPSVGGREDAVITLGEFVMIVIFTPGAFDFGAPPRRRLQNRQSLPCQGSGAAGLLEARAGARRR